MNSVLLLLRLIARNDGAVAHNARLAREQVARMRGITVDKFKKQLLKHIHDQFKRLEHGYSREALNQITELYDEYCSLSPTYLARHPEKADEDHVGEVSGGRELSKHGVAQAKALSEEILEDVLVVDRPTKIEIEYSPFKRTFLLAKMIAQVVQYKTQHFPIHLSVSYKESDLLSGRVLAIPAVHFKNDKPDNFENFKAWFGSDNQRFTAHKVATWFSRTSPSKQLYVIRIGTTHSPNLAAFLKERGVSVDKAMRFKTADYIQHVGRKYYWEGKER